MKICKNYREFKKILRKTNRRKSPPQVIYYVRRINEAKEVLRSTSLYCDNCLRKMLTLYLASRNEVVRCDGHFGVLRGVKITTEGYSYILELGYEEINCCGEVIAV